MSFERVPISSAKAASRKLIENHSLESKIYIWLGRRKNRADGQSAIADEAWY